MNREQLRHLIRTTIVKRFQQTAGNRYQEYKILNQVPDLIPILTDLLTDRFSTFVKDIDWVAPKPPTFRVILENGFSFYLSDLKRSWVAEVEGKKYYLLNLGEEERAVSAIARMLRYAPAPEEMAPTDMEATFDTGAPAGETAAEEPLTQEPEVPASEEEFEA